METWQGVILGGVVAGVPALIAWLRARNKDAVDVEKVKADATDVITQAAERVVTQLIRALDEADATATRLVGELKTQKETAGRLEDEVVTLQGEISRLRALVIQLGGDPTLGRRAADAE